MVQLGLLIVTLAAATPSGHPDLAAAGAAVEAGRFYDVLPHLERARSQPLSVAEQVEALELEAVTQAAFGRNAESTRAFRLALTLDRTYAGPRESSPKLAALLLEARRQGPLPPVLVPRAAVVAQAPPPLVTSRSAPRRASSVFRRWWFWTGVGVAVAGVATGVALAQQRHAPASTLGNQVLP